jgi:hypothetical protein
MAPTLTSVPDLDAPETAVEAPQEAPEAESATETTDEAPAAETAPKRSRAKKAAEKPDEGGEPVYEPLQVLPFDPLGLELDRKMSYPEWENLIKGLMTVEEGHQWWMGDAIAFGEEKFAEQAFQVFGDNPMKYDMKTLANQASVSRAVPKDVRRIDLSWSHHREVSALDKRAQKRLLNKAAKEKLSCAELKLLVTAELPDNGNGAGTPPQKKRQHPFSVNFSVLADHAGIGATVAEMAGEFVAAELRSRGVEPASFSVKGLPKVTEPTRPVGSDDESDDEWETESESDPDEV